MIVYLVRLGSFMENAGINSCRHKIIGCSNSVDVSCKVEIKLRETEKVRDRKQLSGASDEHTFTFNVAQDQIENLN